MKKIVQTSVLSILLLFSYTNSICQNTFYADQYENTIYSTDLNVGSPMSFDINGDSVLDMNLFMTWETNGGYTDYYYYVEPLNNFEIVPTVFSPNEIIYPNNYNWGSDSLFIAEETFVNGQPIFGDISTTSHVFAKNIIGADTIYAWMKIGTLFDSFFWATASWCACYNNINLGIDTTVYIGETLTLDAGEGFDSYFWNTNETSESILVNTDELGIGNWTFTVVVSQGLCEYTDTINILVISETCLPDGIIFTNQDEIDEFQTNYPGCVSIEGPVTIYGTDISNLTNLNMVTSINGELTINDNALLEDLTGLENIDPNSISQLNVYNNENLSNCNIENVCIFLTNPYPNTNIQNNANGCDNVGEVRDSCDTQSIMPVYAEEKLLIFPNPGISLVTVNTKDDESMKDVIIYNQVGQRILHEKPNSRILNVNELKTGLYIIEVLTKKWISRKKLVIE